MSGIVKTNKSAIQKAAEITSNFGIEGVGDVPLLFAKLGIHNPAYVSVIVIVALPLSAMAPLAGIGSWVLQYLCLLAAANDMVYSSRLNLAKPLGSVTVDAKPVATPAPPVEHDSIPAPSVDAEPVADTPAAIPHAVAYKPAVSTQTAIQQPQTVIQYAQSTQEKKSPDLIERMARKLQSTLIIGVPGAGKGMVLSHLVRRIKSLDPEMTIYAIDPKNDEKETGYWNQSFDHVHRASAKDMGAVEFIDWIKSCLDGFKNIRKEKKLLVIDEFTAVCSRWSIIDQKDFKDFVCWLTFLSSSGDSRQEYVIGLGQNPNASDMGMSGGSRGLLKPFAIVSNHDRRAVEEFCRTRFISIPDGGADELYRIMDKSPVGRAWFSYQENKWLPMPKLENLSGYDRDSRQWITGKPEQLSLPVSSNTARVAHSAAIVGHPTATLATPYPIATKAAKALAGGSTKQQAMGKLIEWLIESGDGAQFSNSDIAKSPWAATAVRSGAIADRKQTSIAPYLQWLKSKKLLIEGAQKWTIKLR